MPVRRVKLQDTGEIVRKDTESIYQAPNKKYYSSEDAYLLMDLESKNRDKCIEIMYDFMKYDPKYKIDTYFFKKLAEWHEGYSFGVIRSAMELASSGIEYANQTKKFDFERGKLNYFMAIIQNKLNDALKIENMRQKVKRTIKDNNAESMLDGIESLQSLPTKSSRGTDVSSLVGDFDG